MSVAIMTDEQVIQAKKDIIRWVTKQIKNDTFGLVYQVLWQMKLYFDDVEEALLTPEQRMKQAKKLMKKLSHP